MGRLGTRTCRSRLGVATRSRLGVLGCPGDGTVYMVFTDDATGYTVSDDFFDGPARWVQDNDRWNEYLDAENPLQYDVPVFDSEIPRWSPGFQGEHFISPGQPGYVGEDQMFASEDVFQLGTPRRCIRYPMPRPIPSAEPLIQAFKDVTRGKVKPARICFIFDVSNSYNPSFTFQFTPAVYPDSRIWRPFPLGEPPGPSVIKDFTDWLTETQKWNGPISDMAPPVDGERPIFPGTMGLRGFRSDVNKKIDFWNSRFLHPFSTDNEPYAEEGIGYIGGRALWLWGLWRAVDMMRKVVDAGVLA